MQKHTLAAVLSASLLFVGAGALAQNAPMQPTPMQTTTTTTTTRVSSPTGALSEPAIRAGIANAGYQEVKGLKFKDGVW